MPFNNEAKEVKANALTRQCDVNATTKDNALPSAIELRHSQIEEFAERHNF
jgi:hypothetical protein